MNGGKKLSTTIANYQINRLLLYFSRGKVGWRVLVADFLLPIPQTG